MLEPVITLLTETFLYAFGCTKADKFSGLTMKAISDASFKGAKDTSFSVMPLLIMCLDIVTTTTKASTTSDLLGKHLPPQNCNVCLLVTSCKFVLTFLNVQRSEHEAIYADYIERKMQLLFQSDTKMHGSGLCLLAHINNIVGRINRESVIGQDVACLLREVMAAFVMCTSYGEKLVALVSDVTGERVTDIMECLRLLATRDIRDRIGPSEGAAATLLLSFAGVFAELLSDAILGDVIRRHANGALFLQSNLISLRTGIDYFWSQQYHCMIDFFSDLLIQAQENSAK